MDFSCPLHAGRQRRWIEQKIYETLLIFDRKPDDVGLFDCPVRGLLCGGNDEIADAAALHFSSSLHHSQGIGCDTRFDARTTILFSRHHATSLSTLHRCTAIHRTMSRILLHRYGRGGDQAQASFRILRPSERATARSRSIQEAISDLFLTSSRGLSSRSATTVYPWASARSDAPRRAAPALATGS